MAFLVEDEAGNITSGQLALRGGAYSLMAVGAFDGATASVQITPADAEVVETVEIDSFSDVEFANFVAPKCNILVDITGGGGSGTISIEVRRLEEVDINRQGI